ncbi:flavin-containing monooxygenase [Paenarthrobacter nicotinovorans]|uniref:flavin-containing monooxygenase n=1 Tax=Paenarthrobacter nicotinovorans TaxID=29320 RepID=UPI003D676BE2
MTPNQTNAEVRDVVIIGAGFAGIYLVHKLRDGLGLDVAVFERGDGVGGTWYWNRYPGARCDVESMFYCYSFDEKLQEEWEWTERYPAQPEILRYANHVADRYDVRRSMVFSTAVTRASYDELTQLWCIQTDDGVTTQARYLITAVGCLSVPTKPMLTGLEDFRGELYYTGEWPHSPVNFAGKRVAVVGTGSSGIQAIPVIAEQAESLTVFQRTATFSAPARNRPLTAEEQAHTRENYRSLRESARHTRIGMVSEQPIGAGEDVDQTQLRTELERRWWRNGLAITGTLQDTLTSLESNGIIAQFVRDKIHEIVDDPAVARLLEPHDYPIGTKRLAIDTNYYASFNRPNVSLVSIRQTPIETFTKDGLIVAGREYEFDVVVLATGYDAMTGALEGIEITGVGGHTLKSAWAEGPKTYLGLSVHGFPNMFTITGPGSPSVMSNMIVSIEQHVEWTTNYIAYLDTNGIRASHPSVEAQEQWVETVNHLAEATLFPSAASWYMGANVPGKPRVFMPYLGGVGTYRALCDEIAASGYTGFQHTEAPVDSRVFAEEIA